MNKLLSIVFLLLMQPSFAQVLVPYRIGDKFGLSNDKGKIVIAPAYDEVKYLQGKYFQYTNVINWNDTIRYKSLIKIKERGYRTGLFYKSKLLIENAPFKHFLIYDYCIANSDNRFHPEDCTLYNLKGERILQEPVKGLGINDRRDFGDLITLSKKFTLLAIFQRDEMRRRIYSIAIYDNIKQQITSWLLNKVTELKEDKMFRSETAILFTYSDESGFHEKYLRFANNKFELIDKTLVHHDNAQGTDGGIIERTPVDIESDWGARVEAPPLEGRIREENDYTYYRMIGDSLFRFITNTKTHVPLPEDVKPIFTYPKSPLQTAPVIFKQEHKFGLIIKGIVGEAKYDSLVYYGDHYIAGITVNGVMKFGILNKQDSFTVPVVYDSIDGRMKGMGFTDSGVDRNRKMFLSVKAKDEYFYGSNKSPYTIVPGTNMVVYQNGKAGVVNVKNEIIIPVAYDLIAENAMNFMYPQRSEFVLLKKNGLYGVTRLTYNGALRRHEMTGTIAPAFKRIPCFYIDDFYGVSGLRLYGLYDEAHKFMGYANEQGFMYYKD